MTQMLFSSPKENTSPTSKVNARSGLRALPPRRNSTFRLATSFAVAFLLFTSFGTSPAGNGLDQAWTAVLAWAHANHLQWGRDLVFTFGPLGFLYPTANLYLPTAGVFLTCQILLGALAATIFALSANEFSRWIFWALWISIAASTSVLVGDVLWMLLPAYALAATHLRLEMKSSSNPTPLVSTAAFYCSTLWLIKESMLPLVAIWLGATVFLLVLKKRRGLAAYVAFLFIATSSLLWLACKQSPTGVLSYVSRSLLIIAGYGSSMGSMPSRWIDAVGAAVLCGSMFAGLVSCWRSRRNASRIVTLLSLGAILFLAWRAGYTRADAHVMIFYAVVIGLVPLLLALNQRNSAIFILCVALLWGTSFVMLAGIALSGNVAALPTIAALPFRRASTAIATLADLPRLVAQRKSEAVQLQQKFALPRIRSAVGSSTVDMLGTAQGLIFLNGLAYAPRPVFQGYSAYDPTLARMNLRQLQQRSSPAFMLVGNGPIDGRLWSMEDPLVFRELLYNFKPVLLEADYLLVERRPAPTWQFDSGAATAYSSAEINRWIDVDGERSVVLHIDARLSTLGRAASVLVRDPMWFLEVETQDQGLHRYRLLQSVATEGFVLSPLIDSPIDFLNAWTGSSASHKVRRFRVIPMSDQFLPLYQTEYRYALASSDLPKADVHDVQRIFSRAYPGIDASLGRAEGNVTEIAEQGVPVTFAHAPATLFFPLSAGRYRLTGEGGLQSSVLTTPACADGDGVEFRAEIEGSAQQSALLLRSDPVHEPDRRGPQPFVPFEFTLEAPSVLQVRVEPRQTTICDWSYFKRVQIDEVPL